MEFQEEMGQPPSYDSSCLKMSQHHLPAGNKPARYKECLKNHAVGLGSHALDGCCEFLAAGPEGTLDALKCAACNCHRNFHRKEDYSGSPLFLTRHRPPAYDQGDDVGAKRFRTKFTREQKEKMLELAEKLGWRIQKHDEAVVQHFCDHSGVKRHVLKVWMHNNKHTLRNKP